jgi:flagellar FliL protein
VSAQAPAAPLDPETAPPKPSRRPGKRAWIVIAGVLALAGAGGAGAWFWLSPDTAAEAAEDTGDAPAAERAKALYFALEPAFVVNLADEDAVRYLQAELQVMTRDAATLAALEQHAPAVRNRLLLLFGQQTARALAVRRGKETLQAQALAEVRAVLAAEHAPDRIEAVYFTSLVTQ